MDTQQKHSRMLYPIVQVLGKQAGGSGTIIYSDSLPGDQQNVYETYVLTNEHVIDDLIVVKKRFHPVLKRDAKTEVLGTAGVIIFGYEHESVKVSERRIEADVVAYDKDEDLAVLKLRQTMAPLPHVAELHPRSWEGKIQLFDSVHCVGCALLHSPIQTEGSLTSLNEEIEDRRFWMSNAATIFGNSGGALFLADTGEFIGVPSRLDVVMLGWSANAIPHLGYVIPIPRICQFFDDQMLEFLYDDSFTSAECFKRRKQAQKEAERLLAVSEGA